MKSKSLSFPFLIWAVIFIIIPMIFIIAFAFTDDNFNFTFENFNNLNRYLPVFLRSLKLSIISTVICLALGYPVGYIISKMSPKVQNVFVLLTMLPMWMNFLLRTYSWIKILNTESGVLNTVLTGLNLPTIDIMDTQFAIVLGMIYNFLPFMILPIYSVLTKMDEKVIEAAKDLGANNVQVFFKVVLPLSIPGIITGLTMVFVPAISTFIISKLLGGGGANMLIGDLIDMQFLGNAYNPHLGSAISLILMVFILISIGVMRKFDSDEAGGIM